MLNPIHLRTLRECVSTGSFAEAARKLGYTASAVSQQIVLLERSLGAALFERSARSVRAAAVAKLLADRSVFRSNDYGVIRDLVCRGLGVAMLPGLAWPDGGIHPLRLSGREPHRHVLVLHRDNNSNPLLPLALDCLAQASAEFTGARDW